MSDPEFPPIDLSRTIGDLAPRNLILVESFRGALVSLLRQHGPADRVAVRMRVAPFGSRKELAAPADATLAEWARRQGIVPAQAFEVPAVDWWTEEEPRIITGHRPHQPRRGPASGGCRRTRPPVSTGPTQRPGHPRRRHQGDLRPAARRHRLPHRERGPVRPRRAAKAARLARATDSAAERATARPRWHGSSRSCDRWRCTTSPIRRRSTGRSRPGRANRSPRRPDCRNIQPTPRKAGRPTLAAPHPHRLRLDA